MSSGSHGSLERTPGELFRAMGALLVKKKAYSRGALARQLKEHLQTLGVDYHIRTLGRQLAGVVSSVPPEAQAAMRQLLFRANGMRTDLDIERELRLADLWIAPEKRQAEYLSSQRIVPLAQLWLLLNPTRSRRSLATLLSKQLVSRGVGLQSGPLQCMLAGTQPLAKREVQEALFALLTAHGITTEDEARALWERRQKDIASYAEDRALEPSMRLFALARTWRVRTHEPSSRRLATILQAKLRDRGLDLCVLHLQRAVDGKTKYVRRALLLEMEGLLRQVVLGDHDLDSELARAELSVTKQLDLCWVKASPIAELAKSWLLQHPGVSMRQLSIRVAKSVRRMGFPTRHNTIQIILGGHKKRTRGFVYRAMLKQLRGVRDRIPEEHFVVSPSAARALALVSPARPRVPTKVPTGQSSKLSRSATAPTSDEPLDAYLRSASRFVVPSAEVEIELAIEIEEAERELVGVLLRSAAVIRELSESARRLDEGELSPSDIVIGAAAKDEATGRQEHARLRSVLAEIARLDVYCKRRRRELLSRRRLSETRATQLRKELLDLWKQMSFALAETRFSAAYVRRMQSAVDTLVGAAEELCGERGGEELRRLEEQAGLPLELMRHTWAAAQTASHRLTQARNNLVTANLRLVFFALQKYCHRGVDRIDLLQEGNIGLLRAVEKFDRRKGCRFATYAMWWVRACINDALINQSRTIRLPEKVLRLRRLARELDETGMAPSAEHLARRTGMRAAAVSKLLSSVVDTVSMQSAVGNGDSTLEDLLADKTALQPADVIANRELADGIEIALLNLDAREAKVLRLRYGMGAARDHTLEEIGQKFGLTRERIRQIEANALERLRKSPHARKLSVFLDQGSSDSEPDNVRDGTRPLVASKHAKAVGAP